MLEDAGKDPAGRACLLAKLSSYEDNLASRQSRDSSSEKGTGYGAFTLK